MAHYTFTSELEELTYSLIRSNSSITSILPNEPPYITVTEGKHTSKIKLGKFLLKNSILTEEKVKQLIEEYKLVNSSMEAYTTELTKEYVEIYKVPLYAAGSSTKSCMTGMDCVRVYEYDDRLSLLTISIKNTLAARTLVRVDTKEYIKLYIDHNLITPSLALAIVEDKKGYVEGSLEGIRLTRIMEEDSFICPFLDGISMVDDRGSYLLITKHGDIDASSTNGYTISTRRHCPCCCDYFDADDMMYDEDSEEEVCCSCWKESHIYYDSIPYHIDSCTEVIGEKLVPTDLLEAEGYVYTVRQKWEQVDNCVFLVKEEAWHPLDDLLPLVWEFEEDFYALLTEVVYNDTELNEFPSGYYLPEQLEERVKELEEKIASLQTDIFKDVHPELDIEEAHLLTTEISIIKELLETEL